MNKINFGDILLRTGYAALMSVQSSNKVLVSIPARLQKPMLSSIRFESIIESDGVRFLILDEDGKGNVEFRIPSPDYAKRTCIFTFALAACKFRNYSPLLMIFDVNNTIVEEAEAFLALEDNHSEPDKECLLQECVVPLITNNALDTKFIQDNNLEDGVEALSKTLSYLNELI